MKAHGLIVCLHIILRMELERAMLRGEVDIDDLPGLWNERMQADLGVVSAGAAALFRGEDTVAQAQSAIAGKRRRGRRS